MPRRKLHLYLLLALTVFGGALRFAFLEKPAIWGDEAATLGRVCGSYQDLLDRLQYDGFGPMHYEAYWWIANGFPYTFETKVEPVRPVQLPERRRSPQKAPASQPTEKRWMYPAKSLTSPVMMTPFVMRFIPALAGMLMIPAMYFLAVQLTNRRVAMIAATFTAFSAYLLVYSRDAKMYMHLWLACTLSVGCMIWWFRCAKIEHGGQAGMRPFRRLAWMCWLASSIAMVGVHATGAAILGLELIFLVTHLTLYPRQWRRAFNGLAALLIALCGILVHHFVFAKFVERVKENFDDSGIPWVAHYNRDRTGIDLIKFTASAFTLSWEWPTESIIENIPIRTYKTFTLSCQVLMGVAVLALFPWHLRRRTGAMNSANFERVESQATSPFSGNPEEVQSEGYSHWISQSHYQETAYVSPFPRVDSRDGKVSGVAFGESSSPARERTSAVAVFFLLLWLIVPAYAMYCRSIVGFYSPWQIISAAASGVRDGLMPLSPPLKILAGLIPIVAVLWSAVAFGSIRRWLIRIGLLAGVGALLFLICETVYLVLLAIYRDTTAAEKSWDSVWMPRYLGYVWPAFAILGAILIARLPTRPLRGVVISFLVGINLLNFFWRVRESEPPTDKIAFDVLASQSADATVRAYTQVRHGFGAPPGAGGVHSFAWRYYMIVYGKVPANPLHLRFPGGGFDDSRINVIQNISPQFISSDVKKNPRLSRLIVWDKINAGWADVNTEDRIRKALGPDWRAIDEKKSTAWDHWTWQEMFIARRRVYIRVGSPGGTTAQMGGKIAARTE